MADDSPIRVGDVAQVTDEAHPWYPALLVIAHDHGREITGYCVAPATSGMVRATISIRKSKIARVGRAVVQIVG